MHYSAPVKLDPTFTTQFAYGLMHVLGRVVYSLTFTVSKSPNEKKAAGDIPNSASCNLLQVPFILTAKGNQCFSLVCMALHWFIWKAPVR